MCPLGLIALVLLGSWSVAFVALYMLDRDDGGAK